MFGGLLQAGVETVLADQFQGGEACGHGDRVAGQGAGLVNRAEWGDVFHDIPPAAKRTHR